MEKEKKGTIFQFYLFRIGHFLARTGNKVNFLVSSFLIL